MADERISSFVTEEGLSQLLKVDQTLESITQKIVDLNAAGKKAEGLSTQARSIEEVSKAQERLTDTNKELTTSTQALTQTAKQRAAEQARLEKAARAEQKALDDLNNDYKQLSKAYKEAAERASNYALRLGETNAITIQAQKEAAQMAVVLKRLDAAVGINNRNVGNYKSALEGTTVATRNLGGSIQQIGKELPSLSNGFGTFASAIGNNIAPAADAIARFREEQKLLKSEGKATQTLFSALGGAIFSWQTALVIGITLFTVFAKQIGEFISGTKEATDEMGKFDKQLDSIAKSAGKELAELSKLVDAAQDVAASYKERSDAVDKLQKQYPDLFANMDREVILNGDVSKAYDKAAESIIKKATASAQANIIEEAVQKRLNAQLELDAAANQSATEFVYISEQRRAELENIVAQQNNIIAQTEKGINSNKRMTDTIYFLSAAEKKAFEQREKEAKRRALLTEDQRREEDRLKKAVPKDDLTKDLSRLRDLIVEFQIALKSPSKSELDRITKDIQDEIDISGNAIEFKISADFQEEEAKKKADALLQVLNTHIAAKKGSKKAKDKKELTPEQEADEIFRLSMELSGELQNLQRAFGDRKLQQLDLEIKAINDRRDAEILAIEASTLSEEEKRRKIAELNIAAREQEKRIEREKIEAQRRAAIFERGITIAQIIAQTAKAVMSVLPNYVLAGLNAAIGAAQIAAVFAAPLPAYEEGTKGKAHKGGPAIMFEGGKAEAVFEPGKAPWIGTREGVYDLAAGSHVMSNKELVQLANMYTLGMPALIPQRNGAIMDSEGIKQGLKAVQQAIERKPESATYWTWQGVVNQTRINGSTIDRLHNLRH